MDEPIKCYSIDQLVASIWHALLCRDVAIAARRVLVHQVRNSPKYLFKSFYVGHEERINLVIAARAEGRYYHYTLKCADETIGVYDLIEG